MTSLKPEEDYLDEDKPLRHLVKKQNYCIISMLTPKSFPEEKRTEFSDQKILGIKVRGVFETYEDAKSNADRLQKLDKYHNIFVGEVGKWLPFDVDIAEMETEDDPVYREKALNQYMKSYKDSLVEEEVAEKQRKEEQLKGANVVTDRSNIPEATGIGNPELVTEPKIQEKIDAYKNVESNNVQDQIQEKMSENSKIEKELEDSKDNLNNLEEKLSQINTIYNELNK